MSLFRQHKERYSLPLLELAMAEEPMMLPLLTKSSMLELTMMISMMASETMAIMTMPMRKTMCSI